MAGENNKPNDNHEMMVPIGSIQLSRPVTADVSTINNTFFATVSDGGTSDPKKKKEGFDQPDTKPDTVKPQSGGGDLGDGPPTKKP